MHLYIYIQYTVSHKSEYTPHISATILVHLLKGQYYRNETWIYFIYSQCATCIAVKIYCPLKITRHTAIIVKKTGNKRDYTLSDNSYTSFNHAATCPIHHVHVFVCLKGPYKFVYLVLEQLKFGALSTILSYWPLDVQHGTSWQRTLWGFEN